MRISDWSSDVCSSDLGYGLRGSNKLAYGTIAYDLDFATLSATASYAKAAYSQLVDTTSDPDAINQPTVGTRSRQTFVSALSPDSTDKAVDIRLQSNDGSRSEEHTSELQSLMRISYAV